MMLHHIKCKIGLKKYQKSLKNPYFGYNDPPLWWVITPLEIYYFFKNFTLLFLQCPGPYVQGIFWDSDGIKVVQIRHIWTNAKKHAILAHFVRVPYKNLKNKKHRYLPPFPTSMVANQDFSWCLECPLQF